MDEKHTLDDLLVEFTDALLSGREAKATPELEQEERVVRQLAKLMAPSERLDPAFQQRVTRGVMDAWDETRHRRASRPSGILPFNLTQRTSRLVAVAAVFLSLILVVVLVAILGPGANGENQTGTVYGVDSPIVILAVAGAITAAGFYFWNRRK